MYSFFPKKTIEKERNLPLLYICAIIVGRRSSLLNNFSAVVVTAVTANPVRCLILSALRAFHKGRSVKLPNVGTSLILSCTGHFSLGYRHRQHLLIVKYCIDIWNQFSSCRRASRRGSVCCFSQAHSPSLRFLPQVGQSPLQSSLQTYFGGVSRMISE